MSFLILATIIIVLALFQAQSLRRIDQLEDRILELEWELTGGNY